MTLDKSKNDVRELVANILDGDEKNAIEKFDDILRTKIEAKLEGKEEKEENK